MIPASIDYRQTDGIKLYHRGTKSLYPTDHEGYEGTANNQDDSLRSFLAKLSDKSSMMGWLGRQDPKDSLFQVPETIVPAVAANQAQGIAAAPAQQDGGYINFLSEYGKRTVKQIKAYEDYIIGLPEGDRIKQDMHMAYMCINASLGPRLLIDVQRIAGQDHLRSGYRTFTLLLTIIDRMTVSDQVHVEKLKNSLANLRQFSTKHNGDIETINREATRIYEGLKVHGKEEDSDIILHLYNAYLENPRQAFTSYIRNHKIEHTVHKQTVLTPKDYMSMAETTYSYMESQEGGDVGEHVDVIALKAQLAAQGKEIKRLKKSNPKKGGVRFKDKKDGSSKNKGKPDWLANNEKPEEAELRKPREWKGKTFWFCGKATGGKCPDKWRLHKPSECKYGNPDCPKAGKRPADASGLKPSTTSKRGKPTASAFQAVADAEQEEFDRMDAVSSDEEE